MDFVSGVIESEDGIVINAPDKINWMIGFTLNEIRMFLIRKNAKVIEITDSNE